MTALSGSSVNFTWSFSGDALSIIWGLPKGGAIDENGKLVNIDSNGNLVPVSVPQAYVGRVHGVRINGSSGGTSLNVFTLSSVTKDDERSYACIVAPKNVLYPAVFNSVHLAVEGG